MYLIVKSMLMLSKHLFMGILFMQATDELCYSLFNTGCSFIEEAMASDEKINICLTLKYTHKIRNTTSVFMKIFIQHWFKKKF